MPTAWGDRRGASRKTRRQWRGGTCTTNDHSRNQLDTVPGRQGPGGTLAMDMLAHADARWSVNKCVWLENKRFISCARNPVRVYWTPVGFGTPQGLEP